MGRVVVIGSYNRDTVLALSRFPRPGETVAGSGLTHFHGGKGSNQAVQAARCGAAVAIVASLGSDEAAAEALALWQAEGIATGAVVRQADPPTGSAVILVEEGGENSIVIIPGANAALGAAAVEAATPVLRNAACVLAQLETPAEVAETGFRLARAAGAVTVLNAAPAGADLTAGLRAVTDLLVVNETEAAALTGLPAESPPGTLARALGAPHPRGAVVTAGAAGAVWAAPEGDVLHVPAVPISAVVDTTGAGDAFLGALVAALAEAAPMPEALRRGTAAGALACLRAGAVPSLPCAAEITAMLGHAPHGA